MHNQTKAILALLTLTALAALAYAQYGPGEVPHAFDVIMQINDARAAAGFNYTLCRPWDFGLRDFPPYKFAAGKNFTLIIREIVDRRQYGDVFQDYRVSAVANATGFVVFKIPAVANVTKKSDWYVAIVVEWPRRGDYFLVYNLTLRNAALIDVVGNLSGRIDLSGTEVNIKSRLGVIRITHGPGRFGNLSSSAIHTFYVGVNTREKRYDLTFRRTVTIAGTTITLDDYVDPARDPTGYVRGIDSRITSVFGPFTYLGTYVTSLGRAGTDRRDYEVSIDHTRVRYDHGVYIAIEGSRGLVIQSINDITNRTYVQDVNYTVIYNLTYVSITRNMTTGATVPMSCGLVIWNMWMFEVNIRGLLDLKGNPIFNPEHFRFKIQMKMGDNWVTFDRAQGSWKLVISDAVTALRQACSRTISTISDLVDCYRGLGPNRFREAVLDLYETVRLVRLAGMLQLTNNNEGVSTADLTTKLVVEYSYTAGQDTVKATVLEVALAEPGDFTLRNLTVSVLPVQIRLWRWSNYSLPPSVANPREFFYTNPLDLESLRFVVEGDAIYVNRMAYDGAISYDPWLGQVVWTLPPYQPVPGLVGNVKASLLTLFNASGYLPMPPLVANLTKVGNLTKIRYFNYTDAAKAGFFKQFMIGLIESYSYKFRIYWGNTLVGTANIVVYYPVINASGFVQNAYTPSSEVRPNATGRIITFTSQSWRIEGDSYVLTQSGGICQVVIWGSGRIVNVTGGGRVIFSTNYAIVVRLNGTTVCSGDRVTITLGANQRAVINYTVYESLRGVIEAIYGDTKRDDMYAVQVVKSGRFYDREHVIHIAIAKVFQNIMMRDACGNPIMGVRAGLAGASISLVMEIDGKNVTIRRLPVGSEIPVDIFMPIDEWGNRQWRDSIPAYAVLNYFGYTLYPVDNLTKMPASEPVWFNIPIKFGVVRKPVLYLPIAPLNFRVWSQAVSVDYDPLKEPLAGFVVRVLSTDGTEIARSISNKDGYAYAPNLPIGVPIRVVVRTIVPGDDRRWSYTHEQSRRSNDYVSYAEFMGIPTSVNAYTLGTRGEIDSGLVVYDSRLLLDASNATKYICAKDAINLPVEVYDLVVRVFDKTGKYLLRSQPVFFGPYPQATRPFLLNVTLVLTDDYSPYYRASRWRDYDRRDFIILTDFRAIGITGMRSIYRSLAQRYLEDAQRALGCPRPTAPNYSRAINSYALAAMAGFVASASTDRFAAVYLLSSQQPKEVADLCKMKESEAGVAEIARLFMKGQRFRFVVWYMGQKVFDDYVTITGPLVDIKADVYPIIITTVTKSNGTEVDTFVGFTLTDVYVGLALNKTDGMFANKTLVTQLIAPFTSVYANYSLVYILENELVRNVSRPYNIRVDAFVGGNPQPERTWYYGRYKLVTFGGDFVYLPNIVVLRNGTTPKYQFTVRNRPIAFTETIPTYNYTRVNGSLQVPANQILNINLIGAQIVADPANNATYVKLTAYNGTVGGSVREPQLILEGDVVVINGTLVTNYSDMVNANYSIALTVNARCGNISIEPISDGVKISVEAGTCAATVSYVATSRSRINLTISVSYAQSSEYAVGFDRWLQVPYDWDLRQYNVLYRASGGVGRTAVLETLTHTGTTTICAAFGGAERTRQYVKYTYELPPLVGVNVVNYRTLRVELPWKIEGGGRAVVNITAYNITGGTRKLLDFRVYNLTEMLAGTRGTRVVVTLPLNFGEVAANAYNIATKRWTIRYVIEFLMYDPRDRPISVCATKLVPLAANYTTVSMYECGVPPAPGVPERIDPTIVVYAINKTASILNGFDRSYDDYGGFGTPITYVVKSGDVALLPSWYHKTAVAGSRIARIWLIAASDDPSKGPALGTKYTSWTVKDDKVSINIYKFERYLVVNYVPNVCRGGWTTKTFLDEFDGEGRIVGLGFGTSGTSTLVLSNYTKVPMWNSTAMWLAGGVFRLPTVALDALTVLNTADFSIVVDSLTVKYGDYKHTIRVVRQLRVDPGKDGTTLLNGYGFGRTYMFNITDVWAFRLVQPNYEYNVGAYHAGLYDAARYFGLGEVDVSKYLRPLESKYYVQNVLYAGHAETSEWTYRILKGKITEITRGRWCAPREPKVCLTVMSNDTDYKYVFSFPTLPLREIRDWNDRPLANQTIALFDRSGRLYAVVHSNGSGRLVNLLPDISAIGQTNVVRVAWYNGYLVELLRGRPEFTIWIYDQLISRDVEELGNASASSKIRTYVYPLTVTVKDNAGRPLTNMYVKVVDTSTIGQLVNAVNKTGADGGAQVVDLRISKYSSGVLSQVPGTSYYYYVYDPSGALVATGRFELQRGGTVPAAGWNVIATVRYITEIPVENSATRGFMVIRNVEFLNGSKLNVTIPFTVRTTPSGDRVMMLGGKVPVSVEYPVEIYVTHVTLGGQEVPVKDGQYLVFSGKTTDRELLDGLDFAERGLTGLVTIQVFDAAGTPRSDWTVQVWYGDILAAQGQGLLQAVLPRTDVLGRDYEIKVITNAVTPDGKPLIKRGETLTLREKALVRRVNVSTVKVTVQAVDGFGTVRNDWRVVVENVATGMGQVTTELVEGGQYVARVTAPGITNIDTTFVAKGPQMVVPIKIPTAKIIAQVVDGFGKVREEWSVQIIDAKSGQVIASGQGTVGPVEVLGDRQYVVKTVAFGKEFSQTVNVPVGQTLPAQVQVPTARLSITVVDDEKKPIDKYVTSVELTGPLNLMYSIPPKDIEVLAGTYSIKVVVLGRETPPAQVTLNVGDTRNMQIVAPGTAGLDLFGVRIPLPTLVLYGLLFLVIVAILAILIIEYNNWRRRRLMQILAPPK